MRALVRVIVLLVATAQVAACAANDAVTLTPGAARYAAAASPARAAAKKPATERPDPALLARQASPQCERAKPLEGVPADQARAATLDYEQQCYRQLAERTHARLTALQDAAPKTRAFASRHRALLEPLPAPHCEPATPPAGASAAEAREATLDAQRQCYRQFEAGQRQKLDALQDAVRKPVDTPRGQRSDTRRVPSVPAAPSVPSVTY
jgi:hypothetical protein